MLSLARCLGAMWQTLLVISNVRHGDSCSSCRSQELLQQCVQELQRMCRISKPNTACTLTIQNDFCTNPVTGPVLQPVWLNLLNVTVMRPPLQRTPWLLMVLVFSAAAAVCVAMLSKNKRPYDPNVLPPATRLRRNLQDIVADNLLSNNRANELLRDVARCGVPEFRRSSLKPGNTGRVSDLGKKLRAKFGKRSKWPLPYWAKIRVLNKKKRRQSSGGGSASFCRTKC